ncbi:hypothetical protein AMTR_s00011p00086610 [Amborella trichopoda]|uniref:Uncharacterized protein n=1 Tax=Amborella trichopoda TaxID=13333 RepID=W1NFL3_AMBTC|nr:hypothetical protein AMTR_s00011p00086610 [Amborella trichopoda]
MGFEDGYFTDVIDAEEAGGVAVANRDGFIESEDKVFDSLGELLEGQHSPSSNPFGGLTMAPDLTLKLCRIWKRFNPFMKTLNSSENKTWVLRSLEFALKFKKGAS